MKDIKVTIIVPVYNVSSYIIDCMQSVASQNYRGEIECLLIDDCGYDDSVKKIDTFLQSYKGKVEFKVLHHEHNRGLSAARNTGVAHATGDYVYFLDSDDEITKDCIEKLVQPLQNGSFDFVIGGYKVVGDLISCPSLKLKSGSILYGDDITQSYYHGDWYMMAWGKLVNASFIRSNNLAFQEGLLHEDELWSFQVACMAKSMYVVNEETYVYKIRKNSITQNAHTQERKAEAFQRIVRSMVDFVVDNQIKCKYAYLKVYGMLECLWTNLPKWIKIDSRERNRIVLLHRRYLGRIPYGVRLKTCLSSGVKTTIHHGAVLLPVGCYGVYNMILGWGLRAIAGMHIKNVG